MARGATMRSRLVLALAAAAIVVLLLGVTDPWGWWGGPVRESAHSRGDATSAPADADADVAASLKGVGEPATQEVAIDVPLPAPVDLARCDRDRDLHGVVVRVDGSPVAGANLQVVRHPMRRGHILTRGLWYEESLGEAARTARDGTFSLRLPWGESVELRASADGLATVDFDALNAGERVRLVLPPGVALTVRTLDEAGAAVGGAWIRLFRGAEGEVVYHREGTTDEQGTIVFAGLCGGRSVTLVAKHPARGDSGWTDVRLVGQGAQTLDLTLPRGCTVRGVVTDAASGEPLPTARVGSHWTASHAVSTDAAGRYAYGGWTGSGTSVLTALAPGHAPQQKRVGDAATVDFALPPGGRVRGRVLGAGGTPVPGALVASRSTGKHADATAASAYVVAHTDAMGEWLLDGVRTDQGCELVVIADGHARSVLEISAQDLAAGDLDVGDVRLEEERRLSGVVVETDGTPVTRTQVFLCKPKERGARRWAPVWYGSGDQVWTDDLGRFRFRGLGAGLYRIYARPARRLEEGIEVEVPVGRDLGDVRLVLAAARQVRVRVETADGDRIAGLHVLGMTETGQAVGVGGTTGEDGLVVLDVSPQVVAVSLAFGKDLYERYVSRESSHRRLEADTREIRFVLLEAVTTSGRVQDEDGNPVAGLYVRVDGAEHLATATDEEGRFRLRTPKGGPVDLVVNGRAERTVGGGAHQMYETPWRGRVGRVRPGAEGVVLWVRKE